MPLYLSQCALKSFQCDVTYILQPEVSRVQEGRGRILSLLLFWGRFLVDLRKKRLGEIGLWSPGILWQVLRAHRCLCHWVIVTVLSSDETNKHV